MATVYSLPDEILVQILLEAYRTSREEENIAVWYAAACVCRKWDDMMFEIVWEERISRARRRPIGCGRATASVVLRAMRHKMNR